MPQTIEAVFEFFSRAENLQALTPPWLEFRMVDAPKQMQAGPYALWHHEHRFIAERSGTTIEDEVTYALPFGVIGQAVQRMFVRRDLENIFNYRAQKMRELFGHE